MDRFKIILPNLIGLNQSTFLKGGRIKDNICLMREFVVGFGRKSIAPRAVITLNFQKVFNSVKWGGIDRMMEKMGFCDNFIALAMGCYTQHLFRHLLKDLSRMFSKRREGSDKGIQCHHCYSWWC